jgi:hypothetical protein
MRRGNNDGGDIRPAYHLMVRFVYITPEAHALYTPFGPLFIMPYNGSDLRQRVVFHRFYIFFSHISDTEHTEIILRH